MPPVPVPKVYEQVTSPLENGEDVRHALASLLAAGRERFLLWRNKLLMDARFQRFAAWFPLTRPLANKKASALFDICGGFIYSQVLYAAVELELFSALADAPKPIADLSKTLNFPEDGLTRLLKAGAALDLFADLGDGRFTLGELGAAYMANASVGDMVRHHIHLYRDLEDPLALLKNRHADTHLGQYWRYANDAGRQALSAESVEESTVYSRLMASTQDFVTEEVINAYDFSGHKQIMDVGGGSGRFLSAALASAPSAHGVLFDLPSVTPLAEAQFKSKGIRDRARTVAGNFFQDPLPDGADLITLVRILHDHDDSDALALLRACRAVLAPGNKLMIAEPLAETQGARPMGDGYFGIYLWAMGSGRPRTFGEYVDLLKTAGFRTIRRKPTRRPILCQVVLAE